MYFYTCKGIKIVNLRQQYTIKYLEVRKTYGINTDRAAL